MKSGHLMVKRIQLVTQLTNLRAELGADRLNAAYIGGDQCHYVVKVVLV